MYFRTRLGSSGITIIITLNTGLCRLDIGRILARSLTDPDGHAKRLMRQEKYGEQFINSDAISLLSLVKEDEVAIKISEWGISVETLAVISRIFSKESEAVEYLEKISHHKGRYYFFLDLNYRIHQFLSRCYDPRIDDYLVQYLSKLKFE